jgi:uncharacterized protein (TIGR02246 family)
MQSPYRQLGRGIAVLALLSSATAHSATQAAIPRWAASFLDAWYVSYNAGDAHAVAELFTPDATFGADSGRAAIEASLAADFRATRYHCVGQYDRVRALGALAVAWGHESCTEATAGSTAIRRTKERWLVVFERQADGRWLLSRETFEPDDASARPLLPAGPVGVP